MSQIKTFLLQGRETQQGMDILLSFTQLASENMRKALTYHLVNGANISAACAAYAVTKSNFSRDLKILNEVARKIDVYFEINYKRVNNA